MPAGSYSVSISTGLPASSPEGVMTMSGALPSWPANTPDCSALTFQRGWRHSSAWATSALSAFSDVWAIEPPP